MMRYSFDCIYSLNQNAFNNPCKLFSIISYYPHSFHPNKPHKDSRSYMLRLLPAFPQQYRLDQLRVQIAILRYFPQDSTVLPGGVAEYGGVVLVGDDECVQDIQDLLLIYFWVLVAWQELEEEGVQGQVGDQLPDEAGIFVEEVDQIDQQSHYLLLDSESFLMVGPDQQWQMYILKDGQGQNHFIDEQIVEQSDCKDSRVCALSCQHIGIHQMDYLCGEKRVIVCGVLEQVGDVHQQPHSLYQDPLSLVALAGLLDQQGFHGPVHDILKQRLFPVEYASGEAHFQHLHIAQTLRLYVLCLFGVKFSTEQVITYSHQSQSSLSCQLFFPQEYYRPCQSSQLQLVQLGQEVSASEAILQTVLCYLLTVVRIIAIAFLQYLCALQHSQQGMPDNHTCLQKRDIGQYPLQDVHVVPPLRQFEPHHFLGYLFDLNNNGSSGGMQVFIYMLGQLEY